MGRLILHIVLVIALALPAYGRSAYSPRHSGLEPPGGPRQLEAVPGASPGRMPEGGMGYTDAYGNTLTDKIPEEKKARVRPRPGAYGSGQPAASAIPDLPAPEGKPLWSFQ